MYVSRVIALNSGLNKLDGNVKEKYDFEHQIIHEYFLPLDPSSVDVVISTHLLVVR